MAIDMERFWDDAEHDSKLAGVSEQEVAAWESRHGVKLPTILIEALQRQNGGLIRYNIVRVTPLDEMIPDTQFTHFPIRKQVIAFAFDENGASQFFMNFNANGPRGEPSIHSHLHDSSDFKDEAASLADFFAKLLAVTAAPAIDWSETTRLDVVLHQETIPMGEGVLEVVLGRQGGVLVMYEHHLHEQSEIYGKTIIPEPLSATMEQRWFAPIKTFGLALEPENVDGIVSMESDRTSDGNWKNQTDYGVPVYVTVESANKDRLKTLRVTLVGLAAVRKGARREWLLLFFVVVGLVFLGLYRMLR